MTVIPWSLLPLRLKALEPLCVIIRVVVSRDGPLRPIGPIARQGLEGVGMVHEGKNGRAQIPPIPSHSLPQPRKTLLEVILLKREVEGANRERGGLLIRRLPLPQLVQPWPIGKEGVEVIVRIEDERSRVAGPQHCQGPLKP